MSDENKSVETKPVSPLITNLDQLAILDFLENQRFLVCNWKKGSRKWIWVNVGQVKDTGLSKEYWYKMDMNNGGFPMPPRRHVGTDLSAAMEEFQDSRLQWRNSRRRCTRRFRYRSPCLLCHIRYCNRQ
eukprot:103573-Rhodomonas_salina.2